LKIRGYQADQASHETTLQPLLVAAQNLEAIIAVVWGIAMRLLLLRFLGTGGGFPTAGTALLVGGSVEPCGSAVLAKLWGGHDYRCAQVPSGKSHRSNGRSGSSVDRSECRNNHVRAQVDETWYARGAVEKKISNSSLLTILEAGSVVVSRVPLKFARNNISIGQQALELIILPAKSLSFRTRCRGILK
jgi:hypothetical protein